MEKNPKDFALDCIDLADEMAEKAIGVLALGELMRAADPDAIDGSTMHGIGHMLTVYGRAMLEDSDTGSKAARSAHQKKPSRASSQGYVVRTVCTPVTQAYKTSTNPRK